MSCVQGVDVKRVYRGQGLFVSRVRESAHVQVAVADEGSSAISFKGVCELKLAKYLGKATDTAARCC